jgi:nucleoside-diphosphate-sugar epimerase
MKIIVLGGTRFVGRAIVAELEKSGHELLVVHRGVHEPDTGSRSGHIHVERSALATVTDELKNFVPDAAVDVSAKNGGDAEAALTALPPGIRLVAISSCDVYRAFKSVHDGTLTDAVPISEEAPLRDERFFVGEDDENIEIEEHYQERGGVILRLAAVYGENDFQRRHDFVLRRVVAGRTLMPIGKGNFLFSRCYISDVAVAVRIALESAPSGEVYNVSESRTWTIRLLAQKIADAAGSQMEFVTADDDRLPSDLKITATIDQPLLVDSYKLRSTLGWTETDPEIALRRAVSLGTLESRRRRLSRISTRSDGWRTNGLQSGRRGAQFQLTDQLLSEDSDYEVRPRRRRLFDLRLTLTPPKNANPVIRTRGAFGRPVLLSLWSNPPIMPTPVTSTSMSSGTMMSTPPKNAKTRILTSGWLKLASRRSISTPPRNATAV